MCKKKTRRKYTDRIGLIQGNLSTVRGKSVTYKIALSAISVAWYHARKLKYNNISSFSDSPLPI